MQLSWSLSTEYGVKIYNIAVKSGGWMEFMCRVQQWQECRINETVGTLEYGPDLQDIS